ncbi:MAG: T9SS type A sorting domain-containing protein [Bacteroidetes bacterium]|nr:T9SS type A sorting domain-containing protein [Bacteroidota bacterium]
MNRSLLILFLSLLTGPLLATPQCPIVTQSFQPSNNGDTQDASATGWYLDATNVPNAVYFAAKSHRLKAQTLNGEGVWYSRVFAVSGYTGFQVDAKISSEGALTSSEYVKVYYKLNGGPETLIGAYFGNFGTPTVTSPALTGNTVQIVIRIYNFTAGNAEYYIENYDVFKETGPCTVSTIPISINATPGNGVLTCRTTSVTLQASTTASGSTSYNWSGPNNFTSTSSGPSVSTAGTYTVVGTNAAGTGTANFTVTANNTPPDLTATGTSLGCATSGTITASSSVQGLAYAWTGPGGFSSSSQTPNVTTAGTYTVTATDATTGCSASRSVTVTSGISSPTAFWLEDFSLPNGTNSDNGPTAWTSATTGVGTYSVQNNEFKTSFSGQAEGVWTSAMIPITGKTNTVLSIYFRSETASGGDLFETPDYIRLYYRLRNGSPVLVYEDLAGIGNTTTGTRDTTISASIPSGDSVQIIIKTNNSDPTERYYFDNVTLTGVSGVNALASSSGSLTCANTSVTLTGSSTTSGAVYSWTGPLGFTSSIQDPVVSTPGIYTLTVTAGGCSAQDTALVSQNTTRPVGLTATAIPIDATLTCTNNNVNFTAGAQTPNLTYSWTGPDGPIATAGSITVSSTGTYTLTATDPTNGCTATASSVVTQNTTAPQGVTTSALPATAQVTCAHPTILLTGSSTTTGVTYSWTGPGILSASGASATVDAAGTYTVTVTDPSNGCVTTLPGAVTKNVSVPIGLTASPSDVISCFTPTIDLQGGSSTPGVTFLWSGPGGYTANTDVAETSVPGDYTLTVTDPTNGCSASVSTTALADTATPANVTASNNGPLNCTTTSVMITSSSSTPGVDFTWVTPSNTFIAGATAVVTVPGTYTIQVTNNGNGCFSEATTTVIQNTTGCSGSNAVTPAAVSGRAEGFTTDASTGFVYKTYPNPFSTTAFIEFASPVTSRVTVEIYSSYGSLEKLLFRNTVNANQLYKLQVGTAGLSSGTHFCIIRSGDKLYSSRLILVK